MTWYLAIEDELSEAIGLRLLDEQGITPFQPLGKKGNGYLKTKMQNWIALAKQYPVVLLTDLDRLACPVALRTDWFENKPLPDTLCFRIAIREVEAWLLADTIAINTLMGKTIKVTTEPEALEDPKTHLLNLVATKGSRALKEDMIRVDAGSVRQGVGYNARLCHMVRTEWNPARAAERSPSLARARQRLAELAASKR
jgi:hypothetical protein